MKINKIIGMFPTFDPDINDAEKEALARRIIRALESNADADDLSDLIQRTGTVVDPNEADQAGEKIFKIFEAEKKRAVVMAKVGRGMNLGQKWLCGIAAVATFALLYLAFATPWVTKADLADLATAGDVNIMTQNLATSDQVTDATKGLATSDQVTGVIDSQTEAANALKRLEDATRDLVKRSDLDEISDRVDSVAVMVANTESIVTVANTYRARCKKGSTEPVCIDCFATGAKRCYYRKAFQSASAYSVRKATKPCPETAPAPVADTASTESTPDKVEEKVAPEAPVACPAGCEQDCPEGCRPVSAPPRDTTVNLELPHGSEVRVNGALL